VAEETSAERDARISEFQRAIRDVAETYRGMSAHQIIRELSPEGFGVLEKSPYGLDLVKVARLYTKGTLVSGFMMDRTVEALIRDPKLEKLEVAIETSNDKFINCLKEYQL